MVDGDKRSTQPVSDTDTHEALRALARLLARQCAHEHIGQAGSFPLQTEPTDDQDDS